MRARLIAVASLSVVVALLWAGLSVADARLETQFRSSVQLTPQIPAFDEPGRDLAGAASGEFDPIYPDVSVSSWSRENEFIMHHNAARRGWGPTLRPQVQFEAGDPLGGADASGDEDVFDVLVVGDSFVWGMAVPDVDALWPQVLERELNARGGGRFKVKSLGRAPASLAQFADWLTPERLAELDPDLVVVGLLGNDFYPSFEESVMCSSYGTCVVDGEAPLVRNPRNTALVTCLTGDGSALSAAIRSIVNPHFPYVGRWVMDRYCDPDRVSGADGFFAEGRWMDRPEDNPHWWVFVEGVSRLATALEGYRYVLFDYDAILSEERMQQPAVLAELEGSGLNVVHSTSAPALRASVGDTATLQVNPADKHPGSRLTYAYARDVADWVYRDLGLVPGSVEPAHVPRRPLLSNFLPATLEARSGGDWLSVVSNPANPASSPAVELELFMEGRGAVEVEGPCADMGRPHARLMLNPYVPAGSVALLRLSGTKERMVALPVGYLGDGAAVAHRPVVLVPGETLEVEIGGEVTGFLVGPTEAGCPATDVRMPEFQLDIRLKPTP